MRVRVCNPTSNIQKIITHAAAPDETTSQNRDIAPIEYKQFERQFIEGKFNVKIGDTGVSMNLISLYNKTKQTIQLADGKGKLIVELNAGASKSVNKPFPIKVIIKGHNSIYDMEDNDNWQVHISHYHAFEHKHMYWKDTENVGDYDVTLMEDDKKRIWLQIYHYHRIMEDRYEIGWTQYPTP
jgi:hypothetical protein